MALPAARLDVVLLLTLWVSLLMDRACLHVLSCPAECRCRPGDFSIHVHCASRNFTSMPEFPKRMYLELLDLAGNSISVLPREAFREPQALRELYLQWNRIEELETGAFSKMSGLRVLNLAHNKLKRLDDEIFEDLEALEVLVLASNHIPSIPTDLFGANSGLRDLDLSGNQLRAMPGHALSGSHLASLNLSHNPLRGVDAGDFVSLTSLQELRLASVSLKRIGVMVFATLKDLRWLDLSHNELTRVEFGQGLTALRYLDLTGNPLICDCHILEFHRWVSSRASDLQASSQAVCRDPDALSGQTVLDLRIEEVCPDGNETSVATPVARERKESSHSLYDPMLGWYTAATLSSMLVVFLVCITLDKLKRKFCRYMRRRRRRLDKLKYEKSLNKEQKEVTISLVPVSTPCIPPVSTAIGQSTERTPERQNSISEKTSSPGKNNVGRTPSIKNKPRLTLTLPESNRELELPNCLKKADGSGRHSNVSITIETPPRTTFLVHPNCPIHSANGAKNIGLRKAEELESCL